MRLSDLSTSPSAIRSRRRAIAGSIAVLCLALAGVSPLSAQVRLEFTEELEFDRPEAWAMAYFGSITLTTGFGVPRRLPAGAVELGFEGGWVPTLSDEEQRVGFNGIKQEDLNKTSVFGRGVATVGLGAGFSATLGYVPPVEVGGVEPEVLSLSLGRPLVERRGWRLGLRVYAQTGTLAGDITCDRATAAAGADPVRNPFGCERPSADEMSIDLYGAALGLAFPLGRDGGVEPFVTVATNEIDSEFQVDALYFNLLDRTLLVTEGSTVSWTVGVDWRLAPGWRLVSEVFYTSLDIVPTFGARRESRDLVNGRLLVAYRMR